MSTRKRASTPRAEPSGRGVLCRVDALPLVQHQKLYLDLLEANLCNMPRSLRDAGVSTDLLEVWRRDPAFVAREELVREELLGDLGEESVKVALGRKPSTRDSAHLRWLLGKVQPEIYGDRRVVEHHHSGSVGMTMKQVDEEIAILLGADDYGESESGADGEDPETPTPG